MWGPRGAWGWVGVPADEEEEEDVARSHGATEKREPGWLDRRRSAREPPLQPNTGFQNLLGARRAAARLPSGCDHAHPDAHAFAYRYRGAGRDAGNKAHFVAAVRTFEEPRINHREHGEHRDRSELRLPLLRVQPMAGDVTLHRPRLTDLGVLGGWIFCFGACFGACFVRLRRRDRSHPGFGFQGLELGCSTSSVHARRRGVVPRSRADCVVLRTNGGNCPSPPYPLSVAPW